MTVRVCHRRVDSPPPPPPPLMAAGWAETAGEGGGADIDLLFGRGRCYPEPGRLDGGLPDDYPTVCHSLICPPTRHAGFLPVPCCRLRCYRL